MLIPLLASARPANPVGQPDSTSAVSLASPIVPTTFSWAKAGWAGIRWPVTGMDADIPDDSADAIVPATPFRIGGIDSVDLARARGCLTSAIYYEAASEGDSGERAVAQVVLKRVRHPAFPNSICGVVYEGATRTTGCQFAFTCDGSRERVPSRAGWARASQIADAALGGYVDPAVGMATHYHTIAVDPYWSASLTNVITIGVHIFYRWQGYWGTAKAFRNTYSGVEPLPAALKAEQVVADGTDAPEVDIAGIASIATVVRPAFTPLSLNENPATDSLAATPARGMPFRPLGMARRDGAMTMPDNDAAGKGA